MKRLVLALQVVVKDRRAALLLVTVLAALVYANTIQNRFAYDDHHIVANNEAIQSLQTLPKAVVSPYWPGIYGKDNGLWRPTTQLILGLQWIASNGSPWLFHLTNLLGHAVVTALVLLLLAELMSLPGALLGALVFAVHPVHVEAVANIVGVGEIVSAMCFRVVGFACVVGLVLSLALTRALSGMLFGVGPSDPVTLATVILIVVSVSAFACSLPAMRAALVEPMRVLREE